MPPVPKAVRIKTATGWQDIALVGPQGPQGVTGNTGPQGPPGPTPTYSMPMDPDTVMPTTPVGTIWIDTDAVPLVSETFRTLRTGQSILAAGVLAATTVIPSFFVPTLSVGQTTKLIGARHKIGSGTSIRAQLQLNGSNVGEELAITPTKATTTFVATTILADGDEIGVTFASPLGTPTNLSLTVIFEHLI